MAELFCSTRRGDSGLRTILRAWHGRFEASRSKSRGSRSRLSALGSRLSGRLGPAFCITSSKLKLPLGREPNAKSLEPKILRALEMLVLQLVRGRGCIRDY